ncbi:unnamed protein product [Macrosiphum euphorbiae]|uniref:Macro domain-containing protein n=1 Tax=Macrosiphum euphorbiae TaxID=13131 RepID=A0AAV0XYS1_9HEMI|nr:unnamed protein product [Macrosiphum euphorbiae]
MAIINLSERELFAEIEAASAALKVGEKLATAHCVSEDFQMGSGIAVNFKLKYGALGALMDQKVRVGGVAELPRSDEGGKLCVFYLVTKVLFHHKPTLQSLADSLNQLRDRLIDLRINRLIIPKLGCNLDRLDLYQVRGLLSATFSQEMYITVCDPEYPEIRTHRVAPLRVESRVFCATNNAPDTRELFILPVDISSASTNSTLDRCLTHFDLKTVI